MLNYNSQEATEGNKWNPNHFTLTARGRRPSRYLARVSHTVFWTWWSKKPPSSPPLDAMLPVLAVAETTTSAGLHSCLPNKIEGWVKACPDWLENRQRRPSFPAGENSVWKRCRPLAARRRNQEKRELLTPPAPGCERLPERGRGLRGGANQCYPAPRPWAWEPSPGLLGWVAGTSASVDDVGQRTSGGCGGKWGCRNCVLHQRSRLLPPFTSAPRVSAAPAAGNAPARDRAPSLEAGPLVRSRVGRTEAFPGLGGSAELSWWRAWALSRYPGAEQRPDWGLLEGRASRGPCL